MITTGELRDDVLRALRRTNSEDDKNMVMRFINRFYFSICRSIPIKELRRRITVDLSSATYSSGMWLKSNMADILRVVDVTDEFEYVPRDRASINADETSNRFYDYIPSGDALFTGSDAEVLQGRTTFTSSSLTADHTGEYVKFGSEPGFYLLSAINTFSPTYWGETLHESDFVIRPVGTRKLVCLDAENDEITDLSVYVDYWELPPPLYKDTDVPLLPSTRALELMVMKEAMIIIGKRQLSANSFDKDIKDAMIELSKLNPPPETILRPRDNQNATFTMATNMFTDRNS